MILTLKVTKIEVQKNNKNKVNIFCDGQYLFALHTETLLKNHITQNSEITEVQIEKLTQEDNLVKATEEATKYVSKGLKSRKQIRDFLIKKQYNLDIINSVIEKLAEYNLIDDNAYIQAFIHDHNQYGQQKLKQMLLQKGFSKQKLDEVFSNFEVDLDNLKKLADKYLKNKERTYENIIKCKKYLLSKGFSYEDINSLGWGENESWD